MAGIIAQLVDNHDNNYIGISDPLCVLKMCVLFIIRLILRFSHVLASTISIPNSCSMTPSPTFLPSLHLRNYMKNEIVPGSPGGEAIGHRRGSHRCIRQTVIGCRAAISRVYSRAACVVSGWNPQVLRGATPIINMSSCFMISIFRRTKRKKTVWLLLTTMIES